MLEADSLTLNYCVEFFPKSRDHFSCLNGSEILCGYLNWGEKIFLVGFGAFFFSIWATPYRNWNLGATFCAYACQFWEAIWPHHVTLG